MIVAMPRGSSHGWGIAGSCLADEIAKLPPVDDVTLHCISDHEFNPSFRELWNKINIGYCFFEHEVLAYRFIPEAARRWNFIVAGSHWCEYHLRIAGMDRTSTILQGVDPAFFNPVPPRLDDGRFIVFSGGKFEFRKSHDIVIAAMSIFMARHHDVWLSTSWHNHWLASVRTMEQSALISFPYRDVPCETIYRETLAQNGVDLNRVIMNPMMDNKDMPQVYANSDIGLFPNRCEGGNNMVMCEYMACGRPVIASTMTGHADVITPENALSLTSYVPILAKDGTNVTGVWFEPQVDEVLVLLEQAYQERSLIRTKGEAAGRSMQRLSWSEAAAQFHDIAVTLAGGLQKPPLLSPAIVIPETMQLDAEALFSSGRYGGAEQIYRNLLAATPLAPDLHNSLATVLDRLGRYSEAVAHYNKALFLYEGFTDARFNLANTQKRFGDGKEAIENLQRVVAEEPAFVEAWENLALCYLDDDTLESAADCLEKVVALAPGRKAAHADLGRIYTEMCRYTEAIACFDKILQDCPDDAAVLNSKGIALQELEDRSGAEDCYMHVLKVDSCNGIAINNLGTLRRDNGRPDLALDYYEKALAIEPCNEQVIFNRAISRLTLGDYKNGWQDYEKRFGQERPVQLYHQDIPRWNGAALDGKCLLVQSEQGYGDTLQFVRYLPFLQRFNGRVIFECQDRAIKAALNGLGDIEILARGDALPHIDCQVPLLSLPLIFGTGVSSIPSSAGYLAAAPEKIEKWRDRLSSASEGKLIGINWAGRKTRLNGNRAMRLEHLEPLLDIQGVNFVSLQLGEESAQVAAFGRWVVDLSAEIKDFGDTAAIMSNLDLVITIDSAVAHLAGALGVPAWVMLKYSPDWRWLLDRADSPWYSSVKLFRQQISGDWGNVATQIATKIKMML